MEDSGAGSLCKGGVTWERWGKILSGFGDAQFVLLQVVLCRWSVAGRSFTLGASHVSDRWSQGNHDHSH